MERRNKRIDGKNNQGKITNKKIKQHIIE